MALSAMRGLPPREFVLVQPGKAVELFFGFSNGVAAVKQNMTLWGLVQVPIRPIRWAIRGDVSGDLTIGVSTLAYGTGGAPTSITGTEIPTLAAASNEASSSLYTGGIIVTPLTQWADILADHWVIAQMGAITTGAPKFIGLTIWGVRV